MYRIRKIKGIIEKNRFIRFLLFIPFYLYKRGKRFNLRFSNYIFSHYYYYSGKLARCNEINVSIKELGLKKVVFPHPIGIVIGNHVKIGEGTIIYQNVTLGAKSFDTAVASGYPIVGKNVIIYGNSMVFGSISIGDNSIIGAGSIISIDIPPNCSAYGVNKLKKNDDNSVVFD